MTHTTNRFIDLTPVVIAAAQNFGLHPFIRNDSSLDRDAVTSRILLCRNPQFVDASWILALSASINPSLDRVLWTDDFASRSSVTNWRLGIDITGLKRSRREQFIKSKVS